MSEVIVLAAIAVACWLFRITFVLLMPADRLPAQVQGGLIYLAPAVLAAIAAVELTSVITAADLTGSVLGVAVMGVVALVAYRFRNLSITVVVGLIAILALDLLT